MHTKIIDIYTHKNQAVQDAYAMLAANIHFNNVERRIKTLVLSSCRQGDGKTALAINLSVAMAESGWKVLLVDADIRKPSLSKRLNNESLKGLSEYLMGGMEIEEVLCLTNVPNLAYISCGNECSNPIALLCSLRFEKLIAKMCNIYDFVIFDTTALSCVLDGALLAAKVDAAILVAHAGKTTLTSIKRAKEQLEQLNANLIGIVLNKVKKSDYKTYFESYNYFLNPINILAEKSKSKATKGFGEKRAKG